MNFKSFALKKELINALDNLGYIDATSIQEKVIPKALKGENIIAQSSTGSGKTHAFLIPIINNIDLKSNNLEAIIVSPTRELCIQIYNFACEFNKYFPNLKVKLFISGKDQDEALKSLNNGAHIIISTPGKLNYLLNNTSLKLDNLKTIILDEADMLIDKTFIDSIDSLLTKVNVIQIEVFSATISKNVKTFLIKYISPDFTIENDIKSPSSKTITHYGINIKHQNKYELVEKFINIKNPYLLLIFLNSKLEAKKLYDYLSLRKYSCGILTGDLKSRERNSMIRRINNDEFRYIVCSDIASRGLDIKDVSDILSLDLPNNIEYYYHRAGRTGRDNKLGNSYIFYDKDDLDKLKLLKKNGINLNFLKFDDNSLKDDTSPFAKKERREKISSSAKKEINKVKNSKKSKKVKPLYKKKVKNQIDKIKRNDKKKNNRNSKRYYKGEKNG